MVEETGVPTAMPTAMPTDVIEDVEEMLGDDMDTSSGTVPNGATMKVMCAVVAVVGALFA